MRAESQTRDELAEQLLSLGPADLQTAASSWPTRRWDRSCPSGRAGSLPEPIWSGLALYNPQQHRSLASPVGMILG